MSICLETKQDKFLVVIQNPLSRSVTHYVRLPVDGSNYKIVGPHGDEVFDVFDTIHSFDYIEEDIKPSSKELVFAARDLPPLGLKLYHIEKINTTGNNYKPFKEVKSDDAYFGTEVITDYDLKQLF